MDFPIYKRLIFHECSKFAKRRRFLEMFARNQRLLWWCWMELVLLKLFGLFTFQINSFVFAFKIEPRRFWAPKICSKMMIAQFCRPKMRDLHLISRASNNGPSKKFLIWEIYEAVCTWHKSAKNWKTAPFTKQNKRSHRSADPVWSVRSPSRFRVLMLPKNPALFSIIHPSNSVRINFNFTEMEKSCDLHVFQPFIFCQSRYE